MTFEVDNDALPTANIHPLPTAMTAAAFLGIAWYLSVEVWKLPRFNGMPGLTVVVEEWLSESPAFGLSI